MELGMFYQKINDYWKIGYEKYYVVPNWIYYLVGIAGVLLGFYTKLGLILILIACYKLSIREGRKEGFVDGFTEREELQNSMYENSTSLEEELDKFL